MSMSAGLGLGWYQITDFSSEWVLEGAECL
jgi:hypothetical protein